MIGPNKKAVILGEFDRIVAYTRARLIGAHETIVDGQELLFSDFLAECCDEPATWLLSRAQREAIVLMCVFCDFGRRRSRGYARDFVDSALPLWPETTRQQLRKQSTNL